MMYCFHHLRATLRQAAEIVTSSSPFTETKQGDVKKLIEAACGHGTLSKLKTFDQVFGQFLRTQVSFEAGAWMVCHTGHVFLNVNGDESSACPKCSKYSVFSQYSRF